MGALSSSQKWASWLLGLSVKADYPSLRPFFQHIEQTFRARRWLEGKCVVVTAGATRERIDPVALYLKLLDR
jgi:phosphopantothenoylcysteine synthetase/decarboxylase